MKLQDFDTIAEAKAYTQTQGQMISRNVMNSVLANADIYVSLKAIADTAGPFQNKMAAFFDATDYNFQTGHPIGQANIAVLDAMIAAELPESPALAAIKPVLISMANTESQPYANVTEHAFMSAKGNCPRVPVMSSNGWLQITTSADCESHSPVVWEQPIEGHFVRVGNIGPVEAAGTYLMKTSRQNFQFYVDDAYGVL